MKPQKRPTFMPDFKLDKAKAKAALLYIATNVTAIDEHKLYKILYFAEQKHLVQYGRPITGDAFIKMPFGPVPSYLRDRICNNIEPDNSFLKNGILIIPNEYPDEDELSQSDIECLNESIEENKSLTFFQLRDKSHQLAWNSASNSGRMDTLNIAKEGNASEGILNYIIENLENNLPIY